MGRQSQDIWSADTMKTEFQGITAHWIAVKKGKWKIKAAVIGFKVLSGGHSGENLGRYFMGLLDCIGIMSKTRTIVHQLLFLMS